MGVKALVDKLNVAKAGGGGAAASPKKGASPKAAPTSPKAGGAVDEDAVKKIGDELRVLKEKLKGEGVTGKKLNEHPEIKALVEALNAAKAGGAAADKKGDKKADKKADKDDKAAAEPDRKAILKKVIKEGGKRG